jgi:hypothetical protein
VLSNIALLVPSAGTEEVTLVRMLWHTFPTATRCRAGVSTPES